MSRESLRKDKYEERGGGKINEKRDAGETQMKNHGQLNSTEK